jgi:hypothetical protein
MEWLLITHTSIKVCGDVAQTIAFPILAPSASASER